MFPETRYGLLAGAIYSGLLIYAAAGDAQWRRIPNRLILVIMALGLAFSIATHPGADGLLVSFTGFLVGLACWLPFYVLRWLAAGDVKLFAAAAMWLGPLRALEGAGMAALAGGVLALVWMVWNYGVRDAIRSLWIGSATPSVLASAGAESARFRRTLPYGVALAAGALAAGWMPRVLILK